MGIGFIIIVLVAFFVRGLHKNKNLDTPTRVEVRYTEDVSDATLVR